jgi:hypothetical protein
MARKRAFNNADDIANCLNVRMLDQNSGPNGKPKNLIRGSDTGSKMPPKIQEQPRTRSNLDGLSPSILPPAAAMLSPIRIALTGRLRICPCRASRNGSNAPESASTHAQRHVWRLCWIASVVVPNPTPAVIWQLRHQSTVPPLRRQLGARQLSSLKLTGSLVT